MSVQENVLREDFAAMLDEAFGTGDMAEGSVVKGTVVKVTPTETVLLGDTAIWTPPPPEPEPPPPQPMSAHRRHTEVNKASDLIQVRSS